MSIRPAAPVSASKTGREDHACRTVISPSLVWIPAGVIRTIASLAQVDQRDVGAV